MTRPYPALVAALVLSGAALSAQTGFWRHYAGSINKTIAVQADILVEEESVTGFYFYEKVGKTIALEGRFEPSGSARMEERDEAGKLSGIMEGKFSAGMASFSGAWKSPDGKKALALFLKEDYSGAARLGTYTVIRSRALDEESDGSPEALFVGIGLEALGSPKLKAAMESGLYDRRAAYDWMEGKGRAFLDDYIEGNAGADPADYESMSMNWELTMAVSPVFNARGILCVESGNGGYSGGAHPNHTETHYVFDIATGRRLGLETFIRQEHERELALLVDAAVRKVHGIKPGVPLGEAGFFVDAVEPAAGNFWVDGCGIYFHYPLYEVRPYAAGALTVFVSWKDLGGLSTGHPVTKTP